MTQNNIPFARQEGGPKIAMMWSGGPGNTMPKGWLLNMFTKFLHPLLVEYTIVFLTRRNGMPEGHTTRDMSDDYAELINKEFGGHVDLIIGTSYGGIIAQHFAADHPQLFSHLVIFSAAYKVEEENAKTDYRFAELLNQNKPRQAYQLMASAFTQNSIGKVVVGALFWLIAPSFLGDDYTDVFRQDVMIEAKAELAHDGSESLSRISKPILIQAGEHDHYFPLEYYREMETMIPDGNGKLIVYEGNGHDISDEKATHDILEWVAELENK